MKYSFENDYSEGACKEILEALIRHNFEQNTGYGLDEHSLNAEKLIRKACEHEDIDVHFITGGTPCNVLAMNLLKPYEAVICADTGHINVHETGAVEHVGKKILSIPNKEGKITPEQIEETVKKHTDEHMVLPRLVFIAQASELGTTYTIDELLKIREVCDRYNLYLYIDGARLGSALVAENMSLKTIADIADLFYIGGTKNGAFIGEAMCIKNPSLKENFRYIIKQNCSMLAKGFVCGIEFEKFFESDLYFRLAQNANAGANELRQILFDHNIPEYVHSKTNQIFAIIEDSLIEEIQKEFKIQIWNKFDENHSIVRFVTSWNISEQNLVDFRNYLDSIIAK